MIGNIDLNNKSYEQILDEAIAQIPIYSKDWTNYNVSDPGITILENLSAFSTLLQSEINDVPEKIRFRLLELAGFVPRRGRAARAYIQPDTCDDGEQRLINGAKLYAQDICFEFGENRINPVRIEAVKTDIEVGGDTGLLLTNDGVKGGLFLLGEKPEAGDCFFIYLDRPLAAGENAAIYFDMEKLFERNKFEEGMENPFARVRWDVMTHMGYERLCVEDGTSCFMESGYVKFSTRNAMSSKRIRVTLERADYDIVPKFKRISGLLTCVVQKDTRAFVEFIDVDGNAGFVMENYILSNGYPEVYGLEGDGAYHRYFDNSQRGEDRYCRFEPYSECGIRAVFDGADNAPKRVLAVYRDMSVMAYRSLGILYGYDEQTIELPPLEKVYCDNFSLLIVMRDMEGGELCHIVYPDDNAQGEVNYSVFENDNLIIIHDCGKYEGAEVRLGTYSVYMGDKAVVLPNTELNIKNIEHKFINIASGEGGYFSDSFETLRKRFVEDIKAPVTMVTEGDCKHIVRSVPGLSIHKTGVSGKASGNEIYVVVKPNSLEKFPKLSDIYIDIMKKHFERFRMLTSTVVIRQPVYVPINVTGTLYTKKYLKNSRMNIENTIKKMLDGVNSDAGFGSRVVFHEIYEKLQNMDCVDSIVELSIAPEGYSHASISGLDIKLDLDALFYPGDISLEIMEI